MPGTGNRALGAAGEDAAARWYESSGYEVVARNWRCAEGELDLVVLRRGVLAFCEVKTRRSERFGAPIEAVTSTKAHRIRHLAARFLREHAHHGQLRFDVAGVRATPAGDMSVDVVEGAF